MARNFHGEDIVSELDELTAIRGAPVLLRADNGPEMLSKAVKARCAESGAGTLYIDPGSPWQNGILESFNGRMIEAVFGWVKAVGLLGECATRAGSGSRGSRR